MTEDRFRDSKGRWLTQALFPETCTKDDSVVYRLEDGSGKKYAHLPVLRQLYLDCMDPTEYKFATKYLGGWKHWQRLLDNKMIRAYIDEWREELEVKLTSVGFLQQLDIALDPENKGRGTASKWLAEKGFKPKRAAGAPSKAEKERALRVDERVAGSVSHDLQRIRAIK